jgi:hypothetical protein
MGLGLLVDNFFAWLIQQSSQIVNQKVVYNWDQVWLVSMGFTLVILFAFSLFFRLKKKSNNVMEAENNAKIGQPVLQD